MVTPRLCGRWPFHRMRPALPHSMLACSALPIEGETACEYLLREAGVALGEGSNFGDPYADFVRLTFACPRLLLDEGLERIAEAVERLS